MVAKEFLSELNETHEVFNWQYGDRSQQIRGFLKTGETRVPFDPIAALAFVKSGRAFAQGDWLRAGTMLGLSERDCDAIIDAANNRLWKYVDDKLTLDGYDEWLRTELVGAVGLEPEFDADPSIPNEDASIVDTVTHRPTAAGQPQHV